MSIVIFGIIINFIGSDHSSLGLDADVLIFVRMRSNVMRPDWQPPLSTSFVGKDVTWCYWSCRLMPPFMMTSSNGNILRLLGICAGNSPVTGEFPAQRPMTRSFDVFFDLPLNKQLSKQSWGWWFETPSRPSWRHYTVLQVFGKCSTRLYGTVIVNPATVTFPSTMCLFKTPLWRHLHLA